MLCCLVETKGGAHDIELILDRLARLSAHAVPHEALDVARDLGKDRQKASPGRRLEDEVARYSQCAHAVGCASGTDALLIALTGYGEAESRSRSANWPSSRPVPKAPTWPCWTIRTHCGRSRDG